MGNNTSNSRNGSYPKLIQTSHGESIITNKVTQAGLEWQNRSLERQYFIAWMDGIVFKVRDNGKVINKTVYIFVGLNKTGKKEVLGQWVGKTESSVFWMSVLTDIKARGV